jgi:hypothetical protein
MPDNWTEILNQPGRNMASYAKTSTAAVEQTAPLFDEDEIAAEARRIRALPISEHIYAQGQILGRICAMETNISGGYRLVPVLKQKDTVGTYEA